MKYLERKKAKSGKCAICGCTHFDPCPEGCAWANAEQTICDNPICVSVAKSQEKLLAAIDKVIHLYCTEPMKTEAAMKMLRKAASKFKEIDFTEAKWVTILPPRSKRKTGGAA